MPYPSTSTAAVLKNLNPLSSSFGIKLFTVFLVLLKIADAVMFNANNERYILSPFNGTQANWDEHNPDVYRAYYGQLYSGACGARSLRAHEEGVNYRGQVVSISSITVKKESSLTNTSIDECLRNLAFNVSNNLATFTSSISNDSYRIGNIILGVSISGISILILMSLAGIIYSKYFRHSNAPIFIDVAPPEVAAPAPVLLAVIPPVEVPAVEQLAQIEILQEQRLVSPVLIR